MLSCDLSFNHNAYFRLLPVSDIHISQGSVATYLRCGGILKYVFVANLPMSLSVKKFWKSVNIWGSYGQKFSVLFFWDTVYNCALAACVVDTPTVHILCRTSSVQRASQWVYVCMCVSMCQWQANCIWRCCCCRWRLKQHSHCAPYCFNGLQRIQRRKATPRAA